MTAELVESQVEFIRGTPELLFRVDGATGDSSSVTVSMGTGGWTIGPDGTPCFGSLGVLLDVALGLALLTNRPPGHWGVTTSMAVDFWARIPADGSTLSGQGRAVDVTDTGGLAQGIVRTVDGRTIAVATQQMRFVPEIPTLLQSGAREATLFQSGAREATLLQSGAREATRRREPPDGSSLELTPAGTILQLLDVTTSSREHRVELELRTGPNVSNPLGKLHGGIMLCLSEIAGWMAAQPDLMAARSHPLDTASIHIAYIRPGPVDGVVRFRTELVYRGRTSAVVRVHCVRPDEKACAVATMTYLARPSPWR